MATDTKETIIVERDDSGIVTVTMNRPSRKNAADSVMWSELLATFREIADSTTDRVLVLTGAEGDFCSGADVGGMGNRGEESDVPPKHQLQAMRNITDICLTLNRLAVPTIAKVSGVAVGAGMNMALSCDLVVADDTARFSEIFARRGLSIDFGGSFLLPRRIGLHKAKELALLADIIDAKEAADIGLVNRVVGSAELDAFVADWATRLAAGPPIALAMTKRLLNNSMNVTLEEALDDEGLSQTVNFSTKDTVEAVSAFLEKRSPKFIGR